MGWGQGHSQGLISGRDSRASSVMKAPHQNLVFSHFAGGSVHWYILKLTELGIACSI